MVSDRVKEPTWAASEAGNLRRLVERARRHRGLLAFVLLAGPPLVYMISFFAVPMGLLLRQSFLAYDLTTQQIGGLTIENYARFADVSYLRILWRSIRIGLVVTAVALVLGYPTAYVMARASDRIQRLMLLALVSPLLVSLVIRNYAWLVLLSNDGIVSRAISMLPFVDEPVRLLYRETAVVIGLVHIYLAFMVIPLISVIEKINPSLEEAASTLGANGLRRFIEVVFPLSVPGMAAGCMLVMTLSVSAYVTPTLLSGGSFLVMPTLVAQQVLVILNWPFASAIAVILVAVVVGIVLIFNRVAGPERR